MSPLEVAIDARVLRKALKPVRRASLIAGPVIFTADAALSLEGEEFAVTVDCVVIQSGAGTVPVHVFERFLVALASFTLPKISVRLDDEWLKVEKFEMNLREPEPEPVVLETFRSEAMIVLAEAIRDDWNIWNPPERIKALQALARAMFDANKHLARFDITGDDLLAIVATKIGVDDVARLRGLIRAASRKHPWPDS